MIKRLIPLLLGISLGLTSHSELAFAAPSGTAPTQPQAVTLLWKLTNGQKMAYRQVQYLIPSNDINASTSTIIHDDYKKSTPTVTAYLLTGLPSQHIQILGIPWVFMSKYSEYFSSSPQKPMSDGIHNANAAVAEISPTGALISTWLEDPIANNIITHFQLPSQPVTVGDTWSFNLVSSMLTFNNVFICSRCSRMNTKKLISITKNADGDTIATIRLNLTESIFGTALFPGQHNKTPAILGAKIGMQVNVRGQEQFNITQGRLESMHTITIDTYTYNAPSNAPQADGVDEQFTYLKTIPPDLQSIHIE